MMDAVILALLAAAVVLVLIYRNRQRKNGHGCCSGCAGCNASCPSRGGEALADGSGSGGRKIVFFDIDGTLVDGATHRIPDSAADAVRRLRKNGHLAFINTGRTLVSIEKRIRDIGFDGYVCGCGTHVYYEGETLFSSSIPHKKCVEIIRKLREYRISAFFESPEAVYYDSRCPVINPELDGSRESFRQVGTCVLDFPEELDKVTFTFDKFFCLFTGESDVEGLKEYIRDDFNGIPQGEGKLEVVPKGNSKAEGIRLLRKKFGISLENCYAVGDSENDLEMLKAVPNSIAMGECSAKILPYCSYHTRRVMENGVSIAMEHYGLI